MTTPNTDRELLERAAKAAGLSIGYDSGQYFYCEHGPFGASMYGRQGNTPLNWNPLQDDGDALRLAVKLYIGVRSHGPDHWQQPNVAVALWDFDDKAGRVTVEHSDDPQRATRRAIVRAAAAIGKAMP